jgi:predicted kinase
MMNKLLIVTGVAGSGKTYIGKELAKRLPEFVYLDKDTMTRFLVDKILICLDSNETDRESELYTKEIRPLEYKCLLKQTEENLELGKSCIISAPFIKEIYDENYFIDLQDELEFFNTKLKIIWTYIDEKTARQRILERNAKRDYNKIHNWNEYINTVKHEREPNNNIDMFIIDNRINASIPIEIQLEKAINYIQKDNDEI